MNLRQKIFLVLIILALTELAFLISSLFTSNYYPWLIAPLTQIASIVIGIFVIAFPIRIQNIKRQKKINFIWGFVLIFLGIVCSTFMCLCKIYMVCFLWIAMGIRLIIECRDKSGQDKNQQDLGVNNDNELLDSYRTKQLQHGEYEIDNNSSIRMTGKKDRWSNYLCFRVTNQICFIFISLLILLFTVNITSILFYKFSYNKIGNIITVNYPKISDASLLTFHTYCNDVRNSSFPTIVLEHGGGGNLAGFLPLFDYLQTFGIKACSFDRLGYGRSGKAIPGQTSEQRAQITNLLMSQMIQKSQKIIYGGWSAGVEIAMIYQYYYPQNIQGLIFMDGYPDYMVLEAIRDNLDYVPKTHTLLIANILRVFEPYGVDLFFGRNQIANKTQNYIYQNYYRTGYLWQTQAVDLQVSDATQLLSRIGSQTKATVPYPQSKIYLNWPNTNTNLLFLSASQTIAGDNNMYEIQSKKYIQKCHGKICQLQVISGSHDFPTVAINEVGDKIITFLKQI